MTVCAGGVQASDMRSVSVCGYDCAIIVACGVLSRGLVVILDMVLGPPLSVMMCASWSCGACVMKSMGEVGGGVWCWMGLGAVSCVCQGV